MRIAFAGSHGTGKTTVLKELQKSFPKDNFIFEVARSEMTEKSSKDMTEKERSDFQLIIVKKQIELENSYSRFMSERSLYDFLAYSKGLENYNQIEKMIHKHLEKKPYDIVFYFPIEFELEKDGVRFESLEFQEKIDDLILATIPRNYVEIRGTLKERLHTILHTILIGS